MLQHSPLLASRMTKQKCNLCKKCLYPCINKDRHMVFCWPQVATASWQCSWSDECKLVLFWGFSLPGKCKSDSFVWLELPDVLVFLVRCLVPNLVEGICDNFFLCFTLRESVRVGICKREECAHVYLVQTEWKFDFFSGGYYYYSTSVWMSMKKLLWWI